MPRFLKRGSLLYGTVVRELGYAGLTYEEEDRGSWNRLVIEKPFGYDLISAKTLNTAISQGFVEHLVFRIDYYMAKQTVQNIMVLRFANGIFEPLWNRNFVDHIRVNASETLGVENRAGYYDQAGVLRDMFQNHILELLALVAGEPPSVSDADRVREKKAELFRCLRPFEPDLIDETLSLGQYARRETDGKVILGYREEPGVATDSLTSTYALLKLYVDNWRWQGVPFFITSGQRLKRKVTRIDIQFKQVPHSMFRNLLGGEISANRLVISIYPEENIFLNFQAIKTGTRFCLRTAGLTFSFNKGQKGPKSDAYQKALLDVMVGDQTLFWDQEGLELCWKFVDPIIATSEGRKNRSEFLHFYPAGSLGTDAAINMLPHGSWPEKP
jgi:glucose-6-phosphate 1-dehydrogenase